MSHLCKHRMSLFMRQEDHRFKACERYGRCRTRSITSHDLTLRRVSAVLFACFLK